MPKKRSGNSMPLHDVVVLLKVQARTPAIAKTIADGLVHVGREGSPYEKHVISYDAIIVTKEQAEKMKA
jgi:hypothetical protein